MSATLLMPVEQALERVLASVAAPTEREEVTLAEAYGRTLASDVVSRRVHPPFANSAMDGYALRAADAAARAGAAETGGQIRGGQAVQGMAPARRGRAHLHRHAAARRRRRGGDAGERAARGRRRSSSRAPVALGDHVRAPGGDFDVGEIVLRAGRRLSARDVALAAAADHPTLVVYRRPPSPSSPVATSWSLPVRSLDRRRSFPPTRSPSPALLSQRAAARIDLGIAADDPKALAKRLVQAVARRADVLVTLGGASVGDHDLMRQALADAGMELGFWRVGMRPGKPLIYGRLGATIVLGLPGNPTSSTLCALLFLRPLVRALLGDPDAGADPSEPARLAVALPANGPRRDYARATMARVLGGLDLATPIASQDASLVKAFARADALLVREPNAPAAAAARMPHYPPRTAWRVRRGIPRCLHFPLAVDPSTII